MMNRLATSPEHILVSQDFLERHILRVGDNVRISMALDDMVDLGAEFRVAGVYTHFPTVQEEDNVIIGNLDYVFGEIGAQFPHNIWLRTTENHPSGRYDEATSKTLFSAIERLGIEPIKKQDVGALIQEEQAKFEAGGHLWYAFGRL